MLVFYIKLLNIINLYLKQYTGFLSESQRHLLAMKGPSASPTLGPTALKYLFNSFTGYWRRGETGGSVHRCLYVYALHRPADEALV